MIATSLPISFSDVCLELYGSSVTSGRDLNSAITYANGNGTWNSTYVGSKDSLLNFRGYNKNIKPIVTISTTISGSVIYRCIATKAVTTTLTITVQITWNNAAINYDSYTLIVGNTVGAIKTLTPPSGASSITSAIISSVNPISDATYNYTY